MENRLQLPLVIRQHANPLAYLAIWTPFIAIYQVTNRFPVAAEPRILPFSVIDEVIPFVPELLTVYIAYLPFYLWTVCRSEDDIAANRVFYAAHFQLLLSVSVYALFPVRMPRELFYAGDPYNWADAFWRWFDAPNNCFPSLHVSNCLLMVQMNWTRSYRRLHTAIACAIIASTLFVKQHYFVDLIGGAAVYLGSAAFLASVRFARPRV